LYSSFNIYTIPYILHTTKYTPYNALFVKEYLGLTKFEYMIKNMAANAINPMTIPLNLEIMFVSPA
jgi:hypothetical protein